MYTISDDQVYELTIKNSRFITLLYKVDNKSNVENIISKTKINYPFATHYCYAYIIDNLKKSSDDGEPSGTAGIPIIKVLENNNLSNILVIIVRYFGGIKLGANGLIRAYSKCTSNAISKSTIKELVGGVNIDIIFDYNRIKEIDYLLKDIKIKNKDFFEKITYNIDIPTSQLETIKNNNIEYKIISYLKIEK